MDLSSGDLPCGPAHIFHLGHKKGKSYDRSRRRFETHETPKDRKGSKSPGLLSFLSKKYQKKGKGKKEDKPVM